MHISLVNIYRKDFIHASMRLQNSSSQCRDTTPANAINNDNSIFPQFNGNFLLDEEGANPSSMSSSSYVCRYLQMHTDDKKFPILVRRDSYPGMVTIHYFVEPLFFFILFYFIHLFLSPS